MIKTLIRARGAKRVLLLCHGLGLDGASLLPLARHIASTSPHPLTIALAELPSHGENDLPLLHPSQWWECSKVLQRCAISLAKQEGVDKVDGVLHSMSAAWGLMHQDAWRSMVLLEPIVLPPPYPLTVDACDEQSMPRRVLKRKERFGSLEEASGYLAVRSPWVDWDQEAFALHLKHAFVKDKETGGVRLRCNTALQSQLYLGGHCSRLFDVLREPRDRPTPPCTLVSGADSWYSALLPHIVECLKTQDCFQRHVAIPNTGHTMLLEKEGIAPLASIVVDHLAQTQASSL